MDTHAWQWICIGIHGYPLTYVDIHWFLRISILFIGRLLQPAFCHFVVAPELHLNLGSRFGSLNMAGALSTHAGPQCKADYVYEGSNRVSILNILQNLQHHVILVARFGGNGDC